MKNLRQLMNWFERLSVRERVLFVSAVAVVLYFVLDAALLAPQRNELKTLQTRLAQQKVEIAALNKAAAELSSAAPSDPLAKDRAQRDELRKAIADASSVVGAAANDAHIGQVIRAMAGATPGVTLVSLKTLASEPLYSAGAAPVPAPAASSATAGAVPSALFRHGVEVTVKGRYLALIPYMKSLQRSPTRLFWTNVRLDVNYPEAVLKMTVYTLSESSDSPLG